MTVIVLCRFHPYLSRPRLDCADLSSLPGFSPSVASSVSTVAALSVQPSSSPSVVAAPFVQSSLSSSVVLPVGLTVAFSPSLVVASPPVYSALSVHPPLSLTSPVSYVSPSPVRRPSCMVSAALSSPVCSLFQLRPFAVCLSHRLLVPVSPGLVAIPIFLPAVFGLVAMCFQSCVFWVAFRRCTRTVFVC